jgi:catechol 2,3-dioxygenase-like lactoylglutathione lyase family enzyme
VSAPAVWAGVIVRDLDASVAWYAETTGAAVEERADRWAALRFEHGSAIELQAGDPSAPGRTFPSYGSDAGPPVMPGFAVEDADEAALGLEVARALPGWVVVVAPGGLRVVLAERECAPGHGLVGFAFGSEQPEALRGFFEGLGIDAVVDRAPALAVAPVVAVPGVADGEVVDPDGNRLRLVSG